MGDSIGKIEALVRACSVVTLVLTACLVGTDSETKAIVYTYTKKATFKDLDALMILVYVDAVAAAYSVLQLSRCSIIPWFNKNSLISYNQKTFGWACLLLDQIMAYVVFGSNTSALQASLIAVTGSKAFQWMKQCNRFTRFCVQIGGSLFCGYIASFLLAAASSISAYKLFRLYSPTKFMRPKHNF